MSEAHAPGVPVRRGFVDIAEGQVHYREAGARGAGRPTLVMIHASPGSAKTLEPLMRQLGVQRHVIATDTLGNGDSSPPASDAADIACFADAHLRALAAMGIDRFDLYGTHTGASIACEAALMQPQRIRSLILDGVGLYDEALQAELLRHHLPELHIDHMGSQLHMAWHFVRDAYLFWPWYIKTAAHRRPGGLPDAQVLHDKVVEVLKSARSFQVSYRAALRYDKRQRLPQVTTPTLVTCMKDDMLFAYFDALQALMPQARAAVHQGVGSPQAAAATAAIFENFLAATRLADLPA